MGLDVYLKRKYIVSYDEGKTFEDREETVFTSNITHNLNKMAMEAGIYQACWRPEEIVAFKAKDITPTLEKGLADLKQRPDHFKKFDSENGWGVYDDFVPWVEEYLLACHLYPEATIEVSR